MTVQADARPWWRSISVVALAATALLGLSVAATLNGLQTPGYSKVVRSLSCQHFTASGLPLDAEHIVHLPYTASGAMNRPNIATVCRFALNLTADEVQDTALLTPSFTSAISIRINGERIARSELFVMRNLRFMTLPAFAPLPRDLVRVGSNEFRITLSARPNRPASMGPVFVGPRSSLQSNYQARWFAAAVFPTLVVGGEAALAIIFGLIWVARRRESEFGWLAVFLILGAAHGSVLVPDIALGNPDYPISNSLILWEVTAALMFMRAIAGVPNRRRTWLLAIPPLVLWTLRVFGSPAVINTVVFPAGSILFMGYMSLGLWVLTRASIRGNRDALIILIGMGIVSAFIVHDVLGLFGISKDHVFVARGAMSGLLIMLCTLTTLRFLRAMGQLDHAADAFRLRAAAAEAELRDTYEELRVRREAEAVERERARLMRDLHDGLGGELASMLALADSPEPHAAEIADHARAALADMRLIIGSLEDYGGDLTLALGAWRERAGPQVRVAGLKLDWRVSDLPMLPGLGPAQVLDILRIVQEAVTNVIKHARATRVTLTAQETPEGIVIVISDDGVGIAERDGGNGLRNMASRAERLGAGLLFARRDGLTQVRLTIPHGPTPAG